MQLQPSSWPWIFKPHPIRKRSDLRFAWGAPVFMELDLSISMDRLRSKEDHKCSLSIDPRRT